jgi:hypothetical protein
MARKPAILELVGGKSQRQRVWEAVRAIDNAVGCFTADDLSRRSKVEYEPVRYFVRGWLAAGYLGVLSGWTPGGRGVKNVYSMVRDNGVEAPRVRPNGAEITQGRGSEALWAAMTALDSFTAAFAAEIAQVSPVTAKTTCGLLGRAGYLVAVEPGKGLGKGGRPTVWRVAAEHRHKPRAPQITRLKAIYDPNVHQIVWAEGADDAAEAVDAGEVLS